MKSKYYISYILILSILCLLFCSCHQTPDNSAQNVSTESNRQGCRNNTPEILTGQADGLATIGNDTVTIDLSHSDKGYLMVQYNGNCSKVKFQITGPDSTTYTYNLTPGNYDTFPLTASNGSYMIGVYENIKDTSYSTLFSDTIDVQITDTFTPYLYANQYVNFNKDSKTVAKGSELAASASCDTDVIEAVYNYIITDFSYNYKKAADVQSGYLPDVDQILASKKGICFDYAAVMAAMLRSQRIPTRLEVGYVNDIYHAWISTYVDKKGWINGIIEFNGKEWNLMDPTFASTSSSPKEFLTSNDDYYTKYIY